jgi:hypothetical protein
LRVQGEADPSSLLLQVDIFQEKIKRIPLKPFFEDFKGA